MQGSAIPLPLGTLLAAASLGSWQLVTRLARARHSLCWAVFGLTMLARHCLAWAHAAQDPLRLSAACAFSSGWALPAAASWRLPLQDRRKHLRCCAASQP
jgi:hypothetical protein